METPQDNEKVELKANNQVEGGVDSKAIEDQPKVESSDEPEVSESLDDLFEPEKVEEEKPVDDKPRQGIIDSQVDALLVLDKDDTEGREEILSKYPKIKADVKRQYKKEAIAIGHIPDDRYEKLEKELSDMKESLKGESKDTDSKDAKDLLNSKLKEFGISDKEFKTEYGKEFTSELAKLVKSGMSKTEAMPYVLGVLNVNNSDVEQKRKDLSLPKRSAEGSSFGAIPIAEFDRMTPAKQDKYMEESKQILGAVKFA